MIEAVLVGAGQRGHHVYGAWALRHADRLRFVAVADDRRDRLHRFGEAHGIPDERRFLSADDLFAAGNLGQACVVASPDRFHFRHSLGALAAGYHLLLEKPMAATLAEVDQVITAAAAAEAQLHVAYVLRYTAFFQALHRLITSGRTGRIVTVEHRENVAAYHMAHAYVRGNWSRHALSSPLIVQKCSHDFDILQWNLPSRVVRLASVGSLVEFRPEMAPPGATERCTDPCPVPDCPYDARRIYLNLDNTGWPVHVLTDDMSMEGRLAALRQGPYGVCAYRAGSDVVDHQAVMMQLADGTSATLVMHGHSHEEGRTMRYDGTRGTVRGRFGRHQQIEFTDHLGGETIDIPIETTGGGHGGGDHGVMVAFLNSIEEDEPPLTSAADSYESHLLAFLAEEARLTGEVIDVDQARKLPTAYRR